MKRFLIVFLLCVTTGIPAEKEVCEINRNSVVERLVSRSYPSVFGVWDHVFHNIPPPGNEWEWSYYKKVLSYRDLVWQSSFRSLSFEKITPEGPKLVDGEVEHVLYEKSQIQALNPDFIFLIPIYYYGARPEEYPEDWPYWLRDRNGNRIRDEPWAELLIDYTYPEVQEHMIEQAVAVSKCGIFDGIFMDLWSERAEAAPGPGGIAHLYHGNRVEALVSLVKRIREAVGDDFLIVVNTRTEKIPRSAPYVNGAFMETWDAAYPRERLIELEEALSWYEENLKYPQVNCLEVAINISEPWDSPANRRLARAATTLSLTHSNGYILTHSKPENPLSFWYPFFDAPLGSTVGGNETQGVLYETPKGEEIEGLFIREFTNGWAVYNRSGTAQEIELPQEVSGWSSGVKGKRRHTLADLDGEIYLKAEAPPTADVNGDGVVNIQDLVIVANALGDSTGPDLNGDGVVNIQDLVIVANAFE
ncbi:MAG: putative glycoside hydrolase [Candidatus Poribacteria bacterium]|nr:putative glycoside hydrolase [Candidatus Poribacteria bacterium]